MIDAILFALFEERPDNPACRMQLGVIFKRESPEQAGNL